MKTERRLERCRRSQEHLGPPTSSWERQEGPTPEPPQEHGPATPGFQTPACRTGNEHLPVISSCPRP